MLKRFSLSTLFFLTAIAAIAFDEYAKPHETEEFPNT